MTITFTDPKTKNKLVLSVFEASFSSRTKSSFGRDHSSHGYCSDEATTLWPLRFGMKITGVIDMAKEGRLRATFEGDFVYEKTGVLKNQGRGWRVDVERESTAQKLGGFVIHNTLADMIREKDEALQRPIKQALVAALARVKKDEEVASSAHAARARVADMVRKTVKEG